MAGGEARRPARAGARRSAAALLMLFVAKTQARGGYKAAWVAPAATVRTDRELFRVLAAPPPAQEGQTVLVIGVVEDMDVTFDAELLQCNGEEGTVVCDAGLNVTRAGYSEVRVTGVSTRAGELVPERSRKFQMQWRLPKGSRHRAGLGLGHQLHFTEITLHLSSPADFRDHFIDELDGGCGELASEAGKRRHGTGLAGQGPACADVLFTSTTFFIGCSTPHSALFDFSFYINSLGTNEEGLREANVDVLGGTRGSGGSPLQSELSTVVALYFAKGFRIDAMRDNTVFVCSDRDEATGLQVEQSDAERRVDDRQEPAVCGVGVIIAAVVCVGLSAAGLSAYALWRTRRFANCAGQTKCAVTQDTGCTEDAETRSVDQVTLLCQLGSVPVVTLATPAQAIVFLERFDSSKLESYLYEHKGGGSYAQLGPRWEFDAFEFARASEGHPLAAVTLLALQHHGLVEACKLEREKLARFLLTVEGAHKPSNPYHNATHVTDVVQTMDAFLRAAPPGMFTPLQMLAAIIAASVHDIMHLGVDNKHLVKTDHALARLYNQRNIAESFSASLACELLRHPHLAFFPDKDTLDRRNASSVQELMRRLVVDTDLANHFGIMDKLASFGEGDVVPGELVLTLMIKCADLGHIAESALVHREWTACLIEEMQRQGDNERAMDIPLASQHHDRSTRSDMNKFQADFLELFALPMFVRLESLIGSGVARFVELANSNYDLYRHGCAYS